MSNAPASELLISVAVSWLYLTLVRFLDMNEREPVWALALVFVLGAVGAGAADLLLGSNVLVVPVWGGALAVEASKLLSLGAGILVFKGVARIRGWSEFTDLMDGLVYGIAVGLGYSVGETFLRELHTAQFISIHALQTPLQAVGRAALAGLPHAVFGGMVGLGYGMSREARSRGARIAWPLLGLGGATIVNAAFRVLAHGNALGGEMGLYRAWLAVLIPLAVLIAIGIFALRVERRAIHAELTEEVENGEISPAELALLESFWRRQFRYLGLLLRGRLAGCLHLAALHSRQVQLALLKRRMAGESDQARLLRLEHEIGLVRAAIRHGRAVVLLLLMLVVGSCGDQPASETLASTASPSNPPASASDSAAPLAGSVSIGLDSLIARARRDLDAYWRAQIGLGYRSPDDVGPYSIFSVACPKQKGNARWCPADWKIYYDANFLGGLRSEAGDFVPVFVISHEWGHLVQSLRGDTDPKVGLWTIQIELQADCLAGQWARDADSRGFLKPGEDDQALVALRRLRDPVDYPWFNSDAHGSAGQRTDAFLEGVDGRGCSGADFWKRVHIDPQASLQTTTPLTGSMLTSLACAVGRFRRNDVHVVPESITGTVTDAIETTFESPDGVVVSYLSVAHVSEPAAQAHFDRFVRDMLTKGFSTTKEGTVVDDKNRVTGVWKLLDGPHQLVVQRNRQKVTLEEGPSGATWEFAIAKAEYDCK